jgi:hypothetical protein
MQTTENSRKRWKATSHQNLIRHVDSGHYYARLYAKGKEIWKSFRTSHLSVAQARLSELLKEHRSVSAIAASKCRRRWNFATRLRFICKTEAALINHALVQLGVIVPVQPGEQIPGGKAAEFRVVS